MKCDATYFYLALRKKIDALAKERDCSVIGEWVRSIINHLYWSAVSTPNGNSEVIPEKWLSPDNHIRNKHKGHGKHFKNCKHGRITKQKKWLKRRKSI